MKTPWWAWLLLGYSTAILSKVTPESYLVVFWAGASIFFYGGAIAAFFMEKT